MSKPTGNKEVTYIWFGGIYDPRIGRHDMKYLGKIKGTAKTSNEPKLRKMWAELSPEGELTGSDTHAHLRREDGEFPLKEIGIAEGYHYSPVLLLTPQEFEEASIEFAEDVLNAYDDTRPPNKWTDANIGKLFKEKYGQE